ncbi:hypothetical protein [Corynebacterium vitaeruminis]|uniref:hypothetical protein n=1 Tax=Corynebacterium vitaeruminis TaxID=38305 RepID=UPI0023EF5AFE|nr:hypothetical protein [Corynebacterium vitaeruminis]
MRRIFPFLASVLVLAACGENNSSPSAPEATQATETTSAEAKLYDISEGVDGKVGFRHGLDCSEVNNCSLFFTVESLEKLDTCPSLTIADQPANTHLVRAIVLVEANQPVEGSQYDSGSFTYMADWSAEDKDGVQVPLRDSQSCVISGNEQNWQRETRIGDKARYTVYMDVPDGSTKIDLTESGSRARWSFDSPS